MKINPLIPVGTKIEIEKSKIGNVLSKKIFDDLPQTINCKIIDYKMTDGMGIGYILMTENNVKIWIFPSELNEETKIEYKIEEINNSIDIILKEIKIGIKTFDYEINGNRSIKMLANPLNIIGWFVFTLKDIF
tara:strand:+ start:44 stop:442 length:399 start_codon:yes stop_codon:yes gene_type:complete